MKVLISSVAAVLLVLGGMMWWNARKLSEFASQHPRADGPTTGSWANIKSPSQAEDLTGKHSSDNQAPSPAQDPGTRALSIKAQGQTVLNIANAVERKAAFEKLLAGLKTEAEFQGVLDAFEAMLQSGRRHGTEWTLFWDSLGHKQPRLAAALIDKGGPNKEWFNSAVTRLVERWAARDPQAAIEWVNNNPALSGTNQDMALASLLQGYASLDLQAASRYALSVVDAEDPFFNSVANVLSTSALQLQGTQGVMSWFDSLATDAQKKVAFAHVAARLAAADKNLQREWLGAQAGQPYRNNDAYRVYAQALAEQDPQAAVNYVFQEAPRFDNGRYVGLGYATYEWLVQDAPAFASWYQGLKDPAQKEAVVHAIKDPLADANFPMKRRRAGEQFLQSIGRP